LGLFCNWGFTPIATGLSSDFDDQYQTLIIYIKSQYIYYYIHNNIIIKFIVNRPLNNRVSPDYYVMGVLPPLLRDCLNNKYDIIKV